MYRKPYVFLLFVLILTAAFSMFGCGQKQLQQQVMVLEEELESCQTRVLALQDTTADLRDQLAEARENIMTANASRDSLYEELQDLENELEMAENRVENLQEDLAGARQEAEAARQQARREAGRREVVVRRDVAETQQLLAQRNAQIDSLLRIEEALEDSLSMCNDRVAELTQDMEDMEGLEGDLTARDNRVRTLSILLVVAAAAFVVSLVWAIVKK